MLKKLRSDDGAALSAALLLFLACAVLGALILTAATAAAGRESSLVEMDRRYYSVTSAARLLAKKINGQSVIIKQIKTETTVTTTDLTDDTGSSDTVSTTKKYTTKIGSTVIDGTEDIPSDGNWSFLTQRAIRLLFGTDMKCNSDGSFGYSFSENPHLTGSDGGMFLLTHKFADDAVPAEEKTGLQDNLKIKCEYKMDTNGTLSITVSDLLDSKDHYALTLTADAAKNDEESTSVDTSVKNWEKNDKAGIEETTITTTTKTSTITWTVSGMGGGVS